MKNRILDMHNGKIENELDLSLEEHLGALTGAYNSFVVPGL